MERAQHGGLRGGDTGGPGPYEPGPYCPARAVVAEPGRVQIRGRTRRGAGEIWRPWGVRGAAWGSPPGTGTWVRARDGAWPGPLAAPLEGGSRLLEPAGSGGLLSSTFLVGSTSPTSPSAGPKREGAGLDGAQGWPPLCPPTPSCPNLAKVPELGGAVPPPGHTYLPPHPGWAAWGSRGCCLAPGWCPQSPGGKTTGLYWGAGARPAPKGYRRCGGDSGGPRTPCCCLRVPRTGGPGSCRSPTPSAPVALTWPPLLSRRPPTRPLARPSTRTPRVAFGTGLSAQS